MNNSTSAVILMMRQQVLSPVSGRPPKLPRPGDTPLCYGGGSTSAVSHTCSENNAKSADQLQHQNQLTSSNTKISWPVPTPLSADQRQHQNQLSSSNTKISWPAPTPKSVGQVKTCHCCNYLVVNTVCQSFNELYVHVSKRATQHTTNKPTNTLHYP